MTRKYTPCKSNKKQFSGGGSIVARESADSTTTQECRSADESRGSNPQEECRGTPAVDIGRECLQILVVSEISGPTRCIHSPHKKSHSIACLNYHLSPHQLPSPHPFHHGTYHTTPAGDIGKECLQMLSVSETSRPSTRRIHSERRKSHSIAAFMNYVGLNPSPIPSSVTISSSIPSLPSEGGNHTLPPSLPPALILHSQFFSLPVKVLLRHWMVLFM